MAAVVTDFPVVGAQVQSRHGTGASARLAKLTGKGVGVGASIDTGIGVGVGMVLVQVQGQVSVAHPCPRTGSSSIT